MYKSMSSGAGPTQSSGGAGGFSSLTSKQTDIAILKDGVNFNVRYIGCLEIKTSMKMLDFQTRSQVAKECINRICEATSFKSASRNRRRATDSRVIASIADHPCLENAGTNVVLTVSSRALALYNPETNEVVAQHYMPRISFASGGDSETLDFVAYVAKNDDDNWRACYVIECFDGQSQDLIATIGQAFELRFNEMFAKPQAPRDNFNTDKEYYNDLPDKFPPDLLEQVQVMTRGCDAAGGGVKMKRDRLGSNLIDLNCHDYVNETLPLGGCGGKNGMANMQTHAIPTTAATTTDGNCNNTSNMVRDVFDMQPFSLAAEVQRSQLMTEIWFHGAVTRAPAEALLKSDGDFLVRESQGKPGQYVLTGLESQMAKHLLLIDPEGVVRTKDRVFDSISHLINYHLANALPIISGESALVLRNPVSRASKN